MSQDFDPYLTWLGIRDPGRPPNHYRLLGIELYEGDADVIATAADRQMAHVRTFQSGRHSAESQRLLNELAAAKLCLLNAPKKVAYDADLRARRPAASAAAPAPPPVPPPPVQTAAAGAFAPASDPAFDNRRLTVAERPKPKERPEPTLTPEQRKRRFTAIVIAALCGAAVLMLLVVWGIIVSRAPPKLDGKESVPKARGSGTVKGPAKPGARPGRSR